MFDTAKVTKRACLTFSLAWLTASNALAVPTTGTVTASSDWSSCTSGDTRYTGAKAFDRNAATAWHTGCRSYSVYNPYSGIYDSYREALKTGWIQYDYGYSTVINTYSIQPSNLHNLSYAPKSWTFEAWNGATWIVLNTQSNITGWQQYKTKTFKFSNTASFQKYRLNISANSGGGYLAIGEIDFHKILPGFDFNGDLMTDIAVWWPKIGHWQTIGDRSGGVYWGTSTDYPAPADFDGDGKVDVAYWRPSNGTWYILNSATGTTTTRQWGAQSVGDMPVPADYDGDGKADIAVWRKSTGQWFHIQSSTGSSLGPYWGGPSDVPVMGDFDGDGKADFAVWRSYTGEWRIRNSRDGTNDLWVLGHQNYGDHRVPGDYDGDAKTDIAVYRPMTGEWFIRYSSTGIVTTINFAGLGNGPPVPGDYDGDGKTDLAFRTESGGWNIRYSSGRPDELIQWGFESTVPVPYIFNRY